MKVMLGNAAGTHWNILGRETGMVGSLVCHRRTGPFPWMPYALDNGAYACWDMQSNTFNYSKWEREGCAEWRKDVSWAKDNATLRSTDLPPGVPPDWMNPLWAIVPDVPGDWEETRKRWSLYAPELEGLRLAIAVQDGALPDAVRALDPPPDVICVGGTTYWKWQTVDLWTRSFPRVHVLRVNTMGCLRYCERMGVESCDGTGWPRDGGHIRELEQWARTHPDRVTAKYPVYDFRIRSTGKRHGQMRIWEGA